VFVLEQHGGRPPECRPALARDHCLGYLLSLFSHWDAVISSGRG
jgi:hypothetical protein